jgi:hypothetical protein
VITPIRGGGACLTCDGEGESHTAPIRDRCPMRAVHIAKRDGWRVDDEVPGRVPTLIMCPQCLGMEVA